MGCKGISACSTLLSRDSLTQLQLCNNGLSEASMREVSSILTSHNIAPQLNKLHFFNNMSGHGGCHAFAEILRSSTPDTLLDVRFSGTRADRAGSLLVAQTFHSVGKFTNIQSLDLADNTFAEEGGTLLAQSLRHCPNLQHLNLRDCCLEDDATIDICKALRKAKCPLQSLDLSGNDITSKGATRGIAKVVQHLASSTLQLLHVEENELTSRGISAIMDSIVASTHEGTQPCTLVELKLGTNQCGVSGIRAILHAAQVLTPTLKCLNVDGNMIPEAQVRALHDTFGDVLRDLEDNDPDEDVDAELEEDEEEEEEEEDSEEEEQGGEDSDEEEDNVDKKVDQLALQLGGFMV